MTAEIYRGSCAHTGKGDNKVVQQNYGTSYCPKCKASKGLRRDLASSEGGQVKPFEACLAPHPTETDSECLDRKGHKGDHGFERWPNGFNNPPSELIEWPQEEDEDDRR